MSDMVETHARAYDPVGWKWYDAAADDHPAKPIFRRRAFERSRAAIAALREPTEAMIEIGFTAINNETPADSGPYRESASAAWQAMIDSALNPSPSAEKGR